MNLFVLDTDTLSLLQRGHVNVVRRCAARSPVECAITVTSVEEQLSGRLQFLRKVKKAHDLAWAYQGLIGTLHSLSRLPIISFSPAAVARYQQLIGIKLNVGRMDLRIAATVLEHGAILVTRNLRDFSRIPGLTVEDWSI